MQRPGAVPSPNIWQHPQTYEIENHACDPDGVIEQAMREIADWQGRDLLDLGCGTGFHLPRWACDASAVIGVEPHRSLAALARRRSSRLGNVSVLDGTAQELPLPDESVDVMQARWAYFFGPGCEPGLRELDRAMRRGGTAFVIDNDATRSTFGAWFAAGYPEVRPDEVERFWSRHGWSRRPSTSAGSSIRARISRPSYASSSTRVRRTGRWPRTRAWRWTTRSTSGGATTDPPPVGSAGVAHAQRGGEYDAGRLDGPEGEPVAKQPDDLHRDLLKGLAH